VPVAVNPSEVETVAVSYACAPVCSEPSQAAFVAASKTVVSVCEVPWPTVNGSHGPVEPA
jgi:hypothetical protein